MCEVARRSVSAGAAILEVKAGLAGTPPCLRKALGLLEEILLHESVVLLGKSLVGDLLRLGLGLCDHCSKSFRRS